MGERRQACFEGALLLFTYDKIYLTPDVLDLNSSTALDHCMRAIFEHAGKPQVSSGPTASHTGYRAIVFDSSTHTLGHLQRSVQRAIA